MKRIENHCCNCAVPGYPCRGSSCPRRSVEVHYCEECGAELDEGEIIEVDGEEYCAECFEKLYGGDDD